MLFSHDSLGFLHFYGIYWLSYYDNGIITCLTIWAVFFGLDFMSLILSLAEKKKKKKSAFKHQLKSDSQLYKSIQLNGQYSVSIIHMHDKLYIIIARVTNLFFHHKTNPWFPGPLLLNKFNAQLHPSGEKYSPI